MKKKICKVLSVLLTLLIIFSVCSCVLGTVSAASTKNYIVSSANGDDSNPGTSQQKSVATIRRVIELAIAAGLGEGDTVVAKLYGTEQIKWYAENADYKLPEYDFKLIIKSGGAKVTVGDGSNVELGGETEFENIKVNFGSSEKVFAANGHNVIFKSGVEFGGIAASSRYLLGNYDGNVEYNDAIDLDVNIPIQNLGMSSQNGDVTYNNTVKVNYNSKEGKPDFRMSSSDAVTTYNKPVQIDIISAASVAFSKCDKAVFGPEGLLQILNHTAFEVTYSSLTGIDTANVILVNNKANTTSLMKSTDIIGKFAVDTTDTYYNIKATNANNPSQIIEPVEGFLTLPAGEWNVTADKRVAKCTYYVKANGNGDGSSPESPLPTVAAAVEKANTDGYITNDEVTVKVVGTENVEFGTIPKYSFKLIVTSNNGAEATVGNGLSISMAGDVEFKNIKVYFGGDTAATEYKYFNSAGNNVTFGDGSVYGGNPVTSSFCIGYSSGTNRKYTKDFTINSKIGIRNFYVAQDYHGVTYDCNVNIIYDYASASPIFDIGNHAKGSENAATTTYNKALNFNIKSASLVKFSMTDRVAFGPDGYMQVINSSASNIVLADAGLTGSVYDGKVWMLNNVTGKNDVVGTTDEKGKFSVKLDDPEHKLVAENMDTGVKTIYDGQNGVEGFITLSAGAYIVTIDRAPIYKNYYVNSRTGVEVVAGTRPANAGTKENPVASYSDAMRLIVSDKLTTGDYATIYLNSDEESNWGSNTPATKANVTVKSTADNVATLKKSSGSVSLTAAKTIFDNIYVNIAGEWAEFNANEKSFTVGPTSTIKAHKLYFWVQSNGKKRVDDVDVLIQGTISAGNIRVYAPYHAHVSTGDINITWDSPTPFGLEFGNEREHKGVANTYSGNININIKQAESFALIANSGAGSKFTGTFNIIINGNIKLPYNVTKNFHNLTVDGGKWYVTNEASDSEFVSFTTEKGKFAIKNNKTAYSRKGSANVIKHTGGEVDLSASSGIYTISDKKNISVSEDSPNKMLYYRLGGGHKHIAQWCTLYDNVTYVYEYTIFSHSYNLTKPIVYEDNRHSVLTEPIEIISEKTLGKAGTSKGNFHRVVCEFTIPEGTNKAESTSLFVGTSIPSHDEGLIMDRTCYRKDDPTKKDLFTSNQKFLDGLDYVTLNYEFWGRVFSGNRGGTGKVEWTDGYQELKIMNRDYSYADYLVYLNDPQDGKWWNDKDVKSEDEFATYAKAYGTFIDQNGDGVQGAKFRLKSDEKSYEAISNASGKFNFGKILTGFYDLYIVDGDSEIHTLFTSFISQDDIVEFTVKTDTSGLVPEDTYISSEDYTENSDGELVEEIGPSGNLKGTVYTPKLETVAGLKVVLDGIGEAITDENGSFGFADIPAGDYELYTINKDGSKYVLRTVTIKENVNLDIKLKYDPPIQSNTNEADNGWIIWVIIASIVALLVVAALVFFLVIKKKKTELPV